MCLTLMSTASLQDVAPASIAQKGSSLPHRLMCFVLRAKHALVKALLRNALVSKETSNRAVRKHGRTQGLFQGESAAFIVLPKERIMKKGERGQFCSSIKLAGLNILGA